MPDSEVTGVISGDRHVTHDELADRVARASTVLDGYGVGAGTNVAIMLRNDIAFLEATYAVQALGAVPVPVNWHYRGDEVAYILADCAAAVLVVHADLLDQISGAVPETTAVLVVDTPPEIAKATGTDPVPAPVARSWNTAVAAVEPWTGEPRPSAASTVYTSGTTGRPKGVRRLAPLNPADPVVGAGLALMGIASAMRTVVCGPMYHTAPNVFGIVAGRTGGLVVMQPRFDAGELLALVERYRITSLHLVPTMMVRLLALPDEVRVRHDLSSLRSITHAAAPCPPEIKRAFIEWLGPIVNEYYGGTETGIVVGCTSEEWLAHPGTVGKAMPGCSVGVLGDDGSWLPAGEIGEVHLWNPGFGDFTYHGRAEDRRAVEHDGLVTIGDIGHLDDDGFLHLCDRRTDMINVGWGERLPGRDRGRPDHPPRRAGLRRHRPARPGVRADRRRGRRARRRDRRLRRRRGRDP
ncbi:long-chain acyl-CoA synthetase [Pseudonocardia ammonioxydans]|uniref:Long-chain acyl-CoA synthetase n=1 Tax=Pseudonocardia ammonioxydans TaxID=260086 RepID=A0A1I5HJC9_PSUAM|nr:AMP-binding protein [Pseudonocardia ammonioxydans]SFO48046.1 long-chain acyl-CoA synthetase [Pseudonocardia ammonioxydans]